MFVVDVLSSRLVPDELWTIVEPLIPPFQRRVQGGGTAAVDGRSVFTAIVLPALMVSVFVGVAKVVVSPTLGAETVVCPRRPRVHGWRLARICRASGRFVVPRRF